MRKLCVWYSNQKKLLDEMRQSQLHNDKEEQVEKMIKQLGSFIFYSVEDLFTLTSSF